MFEVKDIKDTDLVNNPVVERMSQYDHEQLLFCNDNETGLKAIPFCQHRSILGVEAKGVEGMVGEENDGTVRSSQAHDEGVVDCPEKAKPTRTLITPTMPTQEEMDLHRITHLPYRPWCPECVGFRP